jgi:hypothetical protein
VGDCREVRRKEVGTQTMQAKESVRNEHLSTACV